MWNNNSNNPETQAKWNMDEAQLRRVDYLLTLITAHFQNWDLESLYWTLRSVRREINAKLGNTEKQNLLNTLKVLEQDRSKYIKQEMSNGTFFIKCEEFYLILTDLIKKHGIYFRESDDYGL